MTFSVGQRVKLIMRNSEDFDTLSQELQDFDGKEVEIVCLTGYDMPDETFAIVKEVNKIHPLKLAVYPNEMFPLKVEETYDEI